MATRDLLPGVTPDPCPPAVVTDSRRTVLLARRRAALRDAANVVLLVLVDYVSLTWPAAHIPLLSRQDSIVLVALLNAAVITYVIMSRLTAKWTARRIASTWCLRERARFFQRESL